MARTDWESAWVDLQAQIAEEKSGYGRQELLEKMSSLAVKHRVSEDLIERVARVFGVRSAFPIIPPEEATAGGRAEPAPDKSVDPGHSTTEEVTNGSSNGKQAEAARP